MDSSKDYLVELIKKLIDGKVQFIVCGGVAAVLHGVERLTMDLDLDLDLDLEMSRVNLLCFFTGDEY